MWNVCEQARLILVCAFKMVLPLQRGFEPPNGATVMADTKGQFNRSALEALD